MCARRVHSDHESLGTLAELARPEFEAFLGVNNAFERKNGALSIKYRQLIAIAVACTIQCEYCMNAHATAAKKAGATREEIAEAVFAAEAIRASSCVMHAALALKYFDEATIPAHVDR